MKTIAFIIALLAPLTWAKAVSPPNTITLIRPDPSARYPRDTILTYGFTWPNGDILYGLVHNITMYYTQPDGSTVPSGSFGSRYTNGDGSFQVDGYTPAQCRTYPGTITTREVPAYQAGKYTLFWSVTYVMSDDPTQANSTYCGPSPYSKQSWVVNSTATVVDASAGTAVRASSVTTPSQFPSSPTGRVNSGAWVFEPSFVPVAAMMLGIGMVA
jgi:hypothetical protein